KLQWQKQASDGTSGDIWIDEVKVSGLIFTTPLSPDPCTPTGLASITLTPGSASVTPGQSVQFAATGVDDCGGATTVNATWSANAPNGLFSTSTEGTYTVTVTDGSVSASATVTVAAIPNTA
ncbi:MAG TPA: hypothetical protein DCR93_16525, partial [Cytophagales bacterium]|nr:hypothetical protein [Cytophagales bacterium]